MPQLACWVSKKAAQCWLTWCVTMSVHDTPGRGGAPASRRSVIRGRRCSACAWAPGASSAATKAFRLGWAVRPHAGQLLCLLPQASSLRDVVQAIDGGEVSAVSLQPVTLEHAYLELLGQPLEG